MRYLMLFALILPVFASADPRPWMKKDNPNELGFDVFVSDKCPMRSDDLKKEFENVLVRSRINPISWFISDPTIHVNVQCFPFDNEPNFFGMMITVDFVVTATTANGANTYMRIGTEPYNGAFIRGREAYLQSSVREYMEDATADYLKANFAHGE